MIKWWCLLIGIQSQDLMYWDKMLPMFCLNQSIGICNIGISFGWSGRSFTFVIYMLKFLDNMFMFLVTHHKVKISSQILKWFACVYWFMYSLLRYRAGLSCFATPLTLLFPKEWHFPGCTFMSQQLYHLLKMLSSSWLSQSSNRSSCGSKLVPMMRN